MDGRKVGREDVMKEGRAGGRDGGRQGGRQKGKEAGNNGHLQCEGQFKEAL